MSYRDIAINILAAAIYRAATCINAHTRVNSLADLYDAAGYDKELFIDSFNRMKIVRADDILPERVEEVSQIINNIISAVDGGADLIFD